MHSVRCFGDPLLFTPTHRVDFSAEKNIQNTIDIMISLAIEEGGVGIAANQCAQIPAPVPSIIIVGYASETALERAQKRYPNMPIPKAEVLINPHIVERSPEIYFPITGEGCISVPCFFRGKVHRHRWVVIRFQDIQGNFHEELFTELRAHIVQHEIDHLNGIVFVHRLINDMSDSQRQQFALLIEEILENPFPLSEQPDVPTLAVDRDNLGHPLIIPDRIKLTFSNLEPEILQSLKQAAKGGVKS